MSTCSDPWLFLRFADKRRGHRNEDGRITAPNFSSRRKSKDGVGSCLTRGNSDRILSSIKVEHSDASDPQLKPASQLPKIEIKLYTTKERRSKPRFITGRNRGSRHLRTLHVQTSPTAKLWHSYKQGCKQGEPSVRIKPTRLDLFLFLSSAVIIHLDISNPNPFLERHRLLPWFIAGSKAKGNKNGKEQYLLSGKGENNGETMDRRREKRSVVGHEVRDLPLLAGHQCGLLRDPKPDTDSGKTEHQAEKPTAEANPDDGEHRQASPALRRQGVPVQVPVPGEGTGVEPGQRGGGGGGSRHRRSVG